MFVVVQQSLPRDRESFSIKETRNQADFLIAIDLGHRVERTAPSFNCQGEHLCVLRAYLLHLEKRLDSCPHPTMPYIITDLPNLSANNYSLMRMEEGCWTYRRRSCWVEWWESWYNFSSCPHSGDFQPAVVNYRTLPKETCLFCWTDAGRPLYPWDCLNKWVVLVWRNPIY